MRLLNIIAAIASAVTGLFLVATLPMLGKPFGSITVFIYQILSFYFFLGSLGMVFGRAWGYVLTLLAAIFSSLLGGGILLLPMSIVSALTLAAAATAPKLEEPAVALDRLYQSARETEKRFVKKRKM